MSFAMTVLAVVLVIVGVLMLGALELSHFWMLGECNDRGRQQPIAVNKSRDKKLALAPK